MCVCVCDKHEGLLCVCVEALAHQSQLEDMQVMQVFHACLWLQ